MLIFYGECHTFTCASCPGCNKVCLSPSKQIRSCRYPRRKKSWCNFGDQISTASISNSTPFTSNAIRISTRFCHRKLNVFSSKYLSETPMRSTRDLKRESCRTEKELPCSWTRHWFDGSTKCLSARISPGMDSSIPCCFSFLPRVNYLNVYPSNLTVV